MTYTLTEAREALAEALSEIDGLQVQPRGVVRAPKIGDGWVTVSRVVPSDFTRCNATLVVVITLGSDTANADDLLETFATDIIDTALRIDDFPAGEISLEPASIVTDGGGTLNGITLTITTEVE